MFRTVSEIRKAMQAYFIAGVDRVGGIQISDTSPFTIDEQGYLSIDGSSIELNEVAIEDYLSANGYKNDTYNAGKYALLAGSSSQSFSSLNAHNYGTLTSGGKITGSSGFDLTGIANFYDSLYTDDFIRFGSNTANKISNYSDLGLQVALDFHVYGDIYLHNGQIVDYSTTTINIDDAWVTLNSGNSEVDSGLIIDIGTGESKLYRKASDNLWYIDTDRILLSTALTSGYIPKYNGSVLANSQIYDNGTDVGIGKTPSYKLDVNGSIRSSSIVYSNSFYQYSTSGIDIYGANGITFRNSASNSMKITGNAVQLFTGITTDTYSSQTTGWGITYSGAADFRSIYSDEMRTKAFVADVTQALAGSDILTKSVSKLSETFTLHTNGDDVLIIVDDLEGMEGLRVFEDWDIVRIKVFDRSGGGLEIGSVWGPVVLDTTYGTGGFLNNTQRYTFFYSSGSIENVEVYAGNLVMDYGTPGDGYIERTVLDSAGSPYIQIATWTTNPWTSGNISPLVRIGNLAGITSTTFGALSGYGIWTSNGYFEGAINATSGLIGGFTINSTRINKSISTYNVWMGADYLSTSYNGFGIYKDSSNYIRMIHAGSANDNYYFQARYSGNEVFKLTSTGDHHIANFNFTNRYFYSGTLIGSGAGIALDSTNKSFMAYKDSNNYISMFYTDSTHWGMKGVSGGLTLFELGDTPMLGGFTISESSLSSDYLNILNNRITLLASSSASSSKSSLVFLDSGDVYRGGMWHTTTHLGLESLSTLKLSGVNVSVNAYYKTTFTRFGTGYTVMNLDISKMQTTTTGLVAGDVYLQSDGGGNCILKVKG